MTDECNVFSLGILAEALCQPGGYEPKRLRSLSRQGSDLVSPFIEAILSSDEDQMQKRLAGLAESLSGNSSSTAWFNLGRLAARLFFRRAAEEYFEKSARLAQAQGDDEGEAQAWNSMGSLYSDDEDWDRACRFYEKALQALVDGKCSSLVCSVLTNLGKASCRRGDISKAEQCYSKMLRLLDSGDHCGRADALHCQGELCQIRGNYGGAEECYQKSLSESEKAQDRGAMAASLAALASVYQLTGAANKVESCLEKARHHMQDIGDVLAEARMRLQLADFFFLEGRHKEAVDHYEKSLPALEEGDSLLAARAQGRMGQCFLDLGNHVLAENHLVRAREILQGQGDSCGVADLLVLLAGNYRLQNRFDEALQCSRQCLEIREQLDDPNAIADAYSCMGLIHADRREYCPGKICFQRAADLLIQNGKCLPAAEAFSNLGSLCHLNGELEDALNFYRRALEIFSELGNEQGKYQTEANLGLIYQSKGEFSLAEDYLQKSLAARDGTDVAGEAGIKLSLGLTAQCKGDWDYAQDNFEQAAMAFEDLGDLHGFSLAQNNLGNLYSDQGDIRKAILCYNLSLDAKRAQNDLHGIATTLANLAAAYCQENELETAEEMYQQSREIFREMNDQRSEGKSLLGLAGAKAKKGELKEAMKHFQDCLQMAMAQEDSPVLTAALHGLVDVSLRLGLWQEAEASYVRVLDALRSLGDSEAVAAVLCSWGNLQADLGLWDHALENYQESLSILEQLGDEYSMAVAKNNLANICCRRGDWTAALENYRFSREGFAKVGDDKSQASVLSNMASLCYKRGEWSHALECYQESLDLFERLEDMAGAAQVLGNLGNFYHRRGERSLAKEHFSRGLEILKRLGDRQGAMEMQSNIDMLRPGRGDIPVDLDDYYRQLNQLKAQGDLSGQAEVLSALASSFADRCQWESALSCYQESLQLFTEVGEIYNQAQIRFNMALVYKDKGDLDGAVALLGEAQEIFQRLDAAPCIAQARLNLGTIFGMRGQAKEAEDQFRQAIDLQEELEAPPDLCEGYVARAQFLVREGRLVEAEFYLSRAEALISCTDYLILNITLYNTQGELYQKEGRYREGKSCFERALSQSRMLSNPYEEAKALSNLGRLALQVKDYPEALVKLQQALAAMSRLGAMHDSLALYLDLNHLFLAQGDYARAEEMAALREREVGWVGYMEHAGCKDEGAQNCVGFLQLSCHEEAPGSKILLAKREKEDSEKLPEPLHLPLQHGIY